MFNGRPPKAACVEINEKPKLEKAISMPVFYSNNRDRANASSVDRSLERNYKYNTDNSISRSASLGNVSISRESIHGIGSKMPFKLSGNVDKFALMNRNGKY